jgi:acyl-CoA synthetase (AMP-forming)/AMP-acid ligase II
LILGGIVTTANPLYTADELAHQLKDSKAIYILTISLFYEKVTQQIAQTVKLMQMNEL